MWLTRLLQIPEPRQARWRCSPRVLSNNDQTVPLERCVDLRSTKLRLVELMSSLRLQPPAAHLPFSFHPTFSYCLMFTCCRPDVLEMHRKTCSSSSIVEIHGQKSSVIALLPFFFNGRLSALSPRLRAFSVVLTMVLPSSPAVIAVAAATAVPSASTAH